MSDNKRTINKERKTPDKREQEKGKRKGKKKGRIKVQTKRTTPKSAKLTMGSSNRRKQANPGHNSLFNKHLL
jgi:hypothetical protein